MNKTDELGTKSIGRLLAQYSIPAVIAMLVNAIYNIVDRIFIGQLAGEEALAGLTIAFPVMMVIFAFSGLVGVGGAALLSIRLGEKDNKGASHVFGNMLILGIIITGAILITLFINLDGVLGLFGASAEVVYNSSRYLKIILYGYIFQMISMLLSGTVRTEGRPRLSMIAMVISGLTNIVLDYIFIGVLGLGVQGAALGTIIAQFTGLIILLSFYLRGKSQLKLKPKDFIPDWRVVFKIISIGFASFIATLGTSVSMTLLNRGLAQYGGTAAITSMGAISSLFMLFIMPMFGIQQGMQPIIGYNFGAKKKDRVYKALKLGILVGIIFSTFVFAVLQIFPKTFIGLFLDEGSETIEVAIRGLRIYIMMLPLLCINFMGIAFFQSIAKGTVALGLGLIRHIIVLIPALLILPGYFGLDGIWAARPLADGIAILITSAALIINYVRDKDKGISHDTHLMDN